ncbi:DEAD/DEAH box helicase family protein [Micromonospora yangpuensis]|uniref:Type I restriction enzyme, R subunit n=1 Tax=Micromonospora yangpuensis TaxID=683228 RepID=A0A1C6TXS6_9ACTN|nr:DEAD/DEAH box helicase family protein [Micromonospora yangpuensis]GGM19973.1 restriction endonuclease subunit R [Micromonospora yangpuensis]SCL46642.1 type I restriction enzyme, R subunit [Micromonospora yangpuensis]
MSNFAFLGADEWSFLFDEARRAERLAVADPRVSCFYARRTLELALGWLYDADATLKRPYRNDLAGKINEATLGKLVGPDLRAKMDIIRKKGNRAVHERRPVTEQDSVPVLRELFHVTYWIARRYTRDQAHFPESAVVFDPKLIAPADATDVQQRTQAQVKALAEKLAARDAALAAEREKSATLDAELARLRAQVAAAKAVNEARPDDHDYDEAQTRDLFIDLLLAEAGWRLDGPDDREFPVTGMPNATGTGFVDYVLWGDDGKPLALVEAKRARRDATVGQQQAKLYADCLEQRYGQRPVVFYTNGYDTWLWDDTAYPPRPVQGFYTKDELALLIQRRASRQPLAEVPIRSEIVERHYQHRAIRKIGEAFERDGQRQALVVMATGAGKTRTVIALVDVLLRANWVKNVLFLADRTALVTQAVNAFKNHLPSVTTVNLVTERDNDGRVYVSTYPTMMGLINETVSGGRRFGPGYFDLVIIDEAHRSVYQKYRAIFSWFDGLLVGLTATPRNEIDRNTYSLFHLEDGVPTDHYDLDEAVAEGYLVPLRAFSVATDFHRHGIRYDDLSEQEQEEWESLDWGDDGPPDSVDTDAVNKWLFNKETVDNVLKTLMVHGHKVAGGDRIGKTIIFARNQAHADFIQQRFDVAYPTHVGKRARVITHKTEYAQSLIDDFAQPEKDPHIAISVDMMDTGIDVPEVVNLVFCKPVRSKSKFLQMIGRGTRLRKDLYGPGQDKKDFLVFDFCRNFEYFNQNPEQAQGKLTESLTERLFKAQLDLIHRLDQRLPADAGPETDADGTQSEAGLRWALARDLHARVEGIRTHLDNFVVRPKRRLVEYYLDFSRWHRLTPDTVDEIGGNLAGLPTSVQDNDEAAKRFDLIVLRLQLGQFDVVPGYERMRQQVQQIASTLLEQASIPAVRDQQQLLDEVAGDEWWRDVTLPMLELMRRRLRGLVRLISLAKRAIVYTDFSDELGEIAVVELNDIRIGTDFERFRAKARVYLREHENHLALQKLRRNKQLSPTDLDELERMLVASGGGTEEIDRARRSSDGLGLFVRSLVGLDRAAAMEAFSEFLTGRTLTANQISFVTLIVDHLTHNGVMEPVRLYESPFSDIAPNPDSIFPSADVERLITILKSVHATAAPATEVA